MRPPTEAALVFSGLNWICIGDEAIAAYVGEATESPPIASRASGSTLGQPRLRRSRGNPNCHQKCIQQFAAVICLYFSKGTIPGFQKGPRHSERDQYPKGRLALPRLSQPPKEATLLTLGPTFDCGHSLFLSHGELSPRLSEHHARRFKQVQRECKRSDDCHTDS
jgi:hypothetical protein